MSGRHQTKCHNLIYLDLMAQWQYQVSILHLEAPWSRPTLRLSSLPHPRCDETQHEGIRGNPSTVPL